MGKHGLKVLGLAAMAAIGMMAFSATAALAVSLELGDKFYAGESGVFLTSGTPSPAGLTTQAVAGKQIKLPLPGRLLIPAKGAEIVCDEGAISTAAVANEYENFITKTMTPKAGHGNATLMFKKCETEQIDAAGALTGTSLTNCVPNFATTPGEITGKALFLVKKHEGVTYILFVPLVTSEATAKANEALTSAFTTLKFDENKCGLPPAVSVTGSLVTKAPVTDAMKPVLNIDSFSAAGKAEQALLGAKLKFGANEAFIKADWELELVGKAGVPWGAM